MTAQSNLEGKILDRFRRWLDRDTDTRCYPKYDSVSDEYRGWVHGRIMTWDEVTGDMNKGDSK